MAKLSRKQILQDFRTRTLQEATRRLIGKKGFDAVTMERATEAALSALIAALGAVGVNPAS